MIWSLLVSTLLASVPLVRGSSSKGSISHPWPSIPDPDVYSAPTGPLYVYPIAINTGLTKTLAVQQKVPKMRFSAIGDIFSLDYGQDVAGKPIFNIESFEGPYVQIEVKYTEFFSDGPYAFSNGLASTFRVETFNITKTGLLTSYFIQGSQRWESIKLIAGRNLVISAAGFEASVDEAPLSSKQGYFASSNSTLTDIWKLGGRTQQLACFAPGTQTTTWDITKEGAYIRGQKPAFSTTGVNYVNYTLSFKTKIDYGGVGWRLDTEIDALQATGPHLILTSEYPAGSFVNYNHTLMAPNTLILGSGGSLQNQTTLPGYTLGYFPLDFNVTEKEWHTIETDSQDGHIYTVRFDGKEIAKFDMRSYSFAGARTYLPGGVFKSFAFGPWQDQAAWYTNVSVTTAAGAVLYTNALTSPKVLGEYGLNTNTYHVCSDAGKRDRFAWLGDRLISSRALAVATGEYVYVRESLEQTFSKQISTGLVPVNNLFGPVDVQGVFVRTTNDDTVLINQMFDSLQTIRHYWLRSGDDEFLHTYWSSIRALASYCLSHAVNDTNMLVSAANGGFAGNVGMLMAVEAMADLATYLNDTEAAEQYAMQAKFTRTAIEATLWNPALNQYVSAEGANTYTTSDIANTLLAQLGTPTRRAAVINGLAQLKVQGGYFDSGERLPFVSPYSESFLLEGLAIEGLTSIAQDLIISTWGPMVRRDENYTAAYWEFLSVDGADPGALFTAGSHFWGSYPTCFLTEYALGVRPLTRAYATFTFTPMIGFQTEWLVGRVPTPNGIIKAAWGYNAKGKLLMMLDAPPGTTATVTPPVNGTYKVEGYSAVQSKSFVVKGGKGAINIVQL